jgi:hypothetical protein
MTSRVYITPGTDVKDWIESYKILGYESVWRDGDFLCMDWKKPKPKPKKEEDKKQPERRTKSENRLRGKGNGV